MAKEISIKKIIKEVQTEADKKNQRRFDGMMEEVNNSFRKVEDQFKGVFQKFDEIDERFDEVDNRFNEVDKRFNEVDKRFNEVDKRFDKIDKTLDSHTEQIANILVDLNTVKLNMQDTKHEVKIDIDKKVDKKHFVDLEGRVRILEKK